MNPNSATRPIPISPQQIWNSSEDPLSLADLAQLDPEVALLSKKINGLCVILKKSPQPFVGLLGRLDWRFRGALSQILKTGFVTGEAGECTYFPVQLKKHSYHLLLVGVGTEAQWAAGLPGSSAEQLRQSIQSLRVSHWGISLADWGQRNWENFRGPSSKNQNTGLVLLK